MKEFNKELIQKQIGYDFGNDDDLLIQAFTHKTYAKEKGWESNQVLEFYGDEVLDFCVAKVLSEYYGYLRSEGDEDFDPREDYDEYITVDDMTEADLTEIKKKLVDNKMLAHRIELMGLQDYLYLGKGAEKQNVQNEEKTKAVLFESLLGDIAFHSNWDMEKLEESVREMLNLDYYLSHGFDEDNDFTQLVQEWWQKRIGSIPDYDYRSSYVLDGGGTINHVASIRLTVDGYPYYFQGEGYTKAY